MKALEWLVKSKGFIFFALVSLIKSHLVRLSVRKLLHKFG